jgi:sugar phosphate isomerase/epimerase
MQLGINMCFAVNRLIEPAAWAEFVRGDLDLDTVQFSFDLLDPWWPDIHRSALIRRIRAAVDAHALVIDSACAGRAHSVPAGLLDPDPAARSVARRWWRRACDLAAELGASAVGGPLGTLSPRVAVDPAARADRCRELVDSIEAITDYAAAAGLRELLIEPIPQTREYPSTISQCLELFDGLRNRCAIPVGFTLDIGQALFEPSFGPQAKAETWISALGAGILMLRVNNSSRLGDPGWGWTHERGQGRAPIAGCVEAVGLDDVPVTLEVCPQFGENDEEARRVLISSVNHCRRYLGISPPKGRERQFPVGRRLSATGDMIEQIPSFCKESARDIPAVAPVKIFYLLAMPHLRFFGVGFLYLAYVG